MSEKYVIGLDFGTDSIRTLIVSASNGEQAATSVVYYPRWMEGKYCIPPNNQFRHHPLDYLESMEECLKSSLSQIDDEVRKNIIGISADTTGSTPALVDEKGNVLALLPELSDNPNAMFILWKDHTSIEETEEINELAKNWGGKDFTMYEGGVYSSEWWWSKILHVLRRDPEIKKHAYSAIELCDWIPAVLTGNIHPKKVKRSRCAAGHKAMWHKSWGGLPEDEFFEKLDPRLKYLKKNMYEKTYTSDQIFGTISSEWAEKMGLRENVVVSVGSFDAHMGAVGAQIKPGSLVKIMGTSTCDVMVIEEESIKDKKIEGICGQVVGSVIPNMVGLEAGQSSFGDVYAWFKNLLSWPLKEFIVNDVKRNELINSIIPDLARAAEKTPINEEVIGLDWFNGRRTPNANQNLRAAIKGLNLGVEAPEVFRTLAESTAFGAKAINECFEDQGIEIEEIIGIGGVAQKSDFVMQVLADVLQRPIKISASDQTCALGACMFAATAAGQYETVQDAQKSMGSGFSNTYTPNEDNEKIYQRMYEKYLKFGDFIENA